MAYTGAIVQESVIYVIVAPNASETECMETKLF